MFNFIKLSVICLMFAGCVMTDHSFIGDDTVNKINVNKIIKGQSHKSMVLDLLGPPQAIARAGKDIMMPAKQGAVSIKVNSDTLFELFSADNEITPDHIVYYYDNNKRYGTGVLFVVVGSHELRTESSRLWVLINDHTGIVDDYRFRKTE